jgi:hypothetical protein
MVLGRRSDCSTARTSRWHGCSCQAEAAARRVTGAAVVCCRVAWERSTLRCRSIGESFTRCGRRRVSSADCCLAEVASSRTTAACSDGAPPWPNAGPSRSRSWIAPAFELLGGSASLASGPRGRWV